MTRASIEQQKNTPWFAKAGAACSIVPISRFVGDHIFALKGGGYAPEFLAKNIGFSDAGITEKNATAPVKELS